MSIGLNRVMLLKARQFQNDGELNSLQQLAISMQDRPDIPASNEQRARIQSEIETKKAQGESIKNDIKLAQAQEKESIKLQFGSFQASA
jgi:hypothetical protein